VLFAAPYKEALGEPQMTAQANVAKQDPIAYRMYIGGEWTNATNGETFESFDPYTGKAWAAIAKGGAEDVDRAVSAALAAFKGEWRTMTASRRGGWIRRLADALGENAEHLAQTEVRDNGKLYAEMIVQTRYLQHWFHYFAGLADKIEGQVFPMDKPGYLAYTRHEPLGVVAAIAPWNSPLLLTVWKLAPALTAGNTVVIKPSEYTSASILEFCKVLDSIDFPRGVINVVTGFGADVGARLTQHKDVAKVAFTGAESTGKAIYRSVADSLKKVTLELGGKSANIVFDDCNVDNAVKGVISGIFAAGGQTCIAGSRLLIQRTIHDEFVEKLLTLAKTARLGNPMDESTQVGPVANVPQLNKILSYIDIARDQGAQVVLGGKRPDNPELASGWFVEPTVLTGVNNQMRVAREEIFGPVLSVIPFEDEAHAVAIANDRDYGLAAGVWTENIARAIRVPDQLEAGTVWVNTYRATSYMVPFGGYKQSGIGREGGQHMIQEYLQTKAIWISTTADVPNPFITR
jgi:acyl-CoA reductase-like NAD-dependent aldehyde dehydrogenase